jgi:hypothetical protein
MIKNLINKLLLGNTQLAGMRTIIVNTIVLIIALWEFATKDGGLFAFLCQVSENITWLHWFCAVSATAFYTSALVFISALNNVLRWLSETPVGVHPGDMPAGYMFRVPDANNTMAIVIGTVVSLSIAAILIVLIF